MSSEEIRTIEDVSRLLGVYPNFPKENVVFRDIHPIMSNPKARAIITQHLTERYKDKNLDAIVGLESRGYYFGIPVADKLGISFVPVRKAGKLPGKKEKIAYGTEYSKDEIEVQVDSLPAGSRVVVFDDLLATGGTAEAALALLKKCSVEVVELHCHIELVGLKGRAKLKDTPFSALWAFD